LKSYGETRGALLAIADNQATLESYTQARENAQARAETIQSQLTEDREQPPEEFDFVHKRTSLEHLEQMIQVDKAQLTALKSRLSEVVSAIDLQPGRSAEVRSRLTELITLLADLEARVAINNTSVEPGTEQEAGLWSLRAQSASASVEKVMLDEELLSQPMRLDLLKAQQDKAIYDARILGDRITAMEQQAASLRQGEADDALAEAELVLAGTEGKHELVQRLADENAELTSSFGQRSVAIEKIRQQDAELSKLAEQLEIDLRSIERKLEVVGMTTAVGEILREQAIQLPTKREYSRASSSATDKITASSMRQIELEDERRQLRNVTIYIEKLGVEQDADVLAMISDDLRELAGNRKSLIAQAVELERVYARALGDLDFTLHRYASAIDQYLDFISERMLWIPSRETFSMFRDGALRNQLKEVLASPRWMAIFQQLPGELIQQPLTMVALLFILVLFYLTPRMVNRLQATGARVGFVRTDLYSNTLQALGLTALLSVRWPLLVLAIAWLFEMQEADSELATAVYVALTRTALYFWMLEFLRWLLYTKGLAESHFGWPTKRTARLWHRFGRFEQTFLPTAFLVVLSISLYPREVGGPIGALAVAVVLLSISHLFHHMPDFMQEKMETIFNFNQQHKVSLWGRITHQVLVWAPVMGIVGVFLGYTYTAIEFALLLIKTVVLYGVMLLCHELGLRWLRMTRRRMIVKRRHEMAQAGAEDSEDNIEEEIQENDPELLNDEGTKLLNASLVIIGLLLLAAIWAEVFPALGILDSVELWSRSVVVDGLETTVPVDLGDVFRALAIAIVGWVALSRIPSLLEILLRQKMNVRAASAYAATRVFQYGGTTVLVVTVLGALGGSWSQIQWAVAALSIGIGFGLQEIVANFISGLIILFEQPIRVGDTVTVGDVSGKVTKIHIRATTIRDFDRRELLVPNKEFITTQLLNWSLSDQVTRRMVQVGVAYGTDMDKAMTIVQEVASAHPLLLPDPEPIVSFDEFGDNSLLISLRFFIDQLEQRLIVSSELRSEINRRFNEAGIVVAFPQRDIHFDASQPLSIRMCDD
jgi:potassium efflux system protein